MIDINKKHYVKNKHGVRYVVKSLTKDEGHRHPIIALVDIEGGHELAVRFDQDGVSDTGGMRLIEKSPEKALETNLTEDAFEFFTEGKSIIKIDKNGDFYYKGRLVTNDMEVYESFKEFLNTAKMTVGNHDQTNEHKIWGEP